jgi:hypothetical protein
LSDDGQRLGVHYNGSVLKIVTNSMYGRMGNPQGGVQAGGYTFNVAGKDESNERTIELAVRYAHDMLKEESLFTAPELENAADPVATRAAELLIRSALLGVWFPDAHRQRLLRTQTEEYVEVAQGMVFDISRDYSPEVCAMAREELRFFASALNVWATRRDEFLGLDLNTHWPPPYTGVYTMVSPAQFMGAITLWPERWLPPAVPRSLAEELTDLDRELAALDQHDRNR